VNTDLARLDAIWQEQRPRIYGLCLSLLRNPADAEDAAQEAFARCARQLPMLTGNPGAFLTVVARNLCLDELRRRRRGDRLVERVGVGESVDPEQAAVDRAALRQAWGELARRDRVLVSSLFTGLSYDEIAARQGWSVEAVRSGLARARRRARTAVGVASALLIPPVAGRLRALMERAQGVVALDPGSTTAAVAATLALAMVIPFASGGGATPGHGGGPVALAAPAATVAGATSGAQAQAGDRRVIAEATATPRPAARLPLAAPVALSGGAPDRQESDNFYSVTPSSGEAQDHTVYASGDRVGCATNCQVLWRSSNDGRTWERLPAAGFTGGTVLAAPHGTRAIYTVGDIGAQNPSLQRSDDGGATFTTAVPGGSAAAFDPTSSSADPQIVVMALGRLLRYDTAHRTVAPFGAAPLLADDITALAFAGDRLLLVDTKPTSGNTVLDCDAAALRCGTALSLPASAVVRLAISPAFAADRTVMAWTSDTVYTSTDGGASYQRTASAAAHYNIDWLSFDATGGPARLALGEWGVDGVPLPARTLVSSSTPDRLDAVSFGLPATVPLHTIAFLPGGTMVAALGAVDGDGAAGLRCSTDRGATWHHTC
jgi:RNA polymerase sigma-70 factor (ECF subfamily)